MWQDYDGGKLDKFVWVEETIGTGSNGAPPPAGGFNPMEGAISMGFYNMNPFTDAAGKVQPGDAAIFKSLADQYAISDNYHQAIMGGTGANFQAIVSGHAAFFTNTISTAPPPLPFSNQIENPDPVAGTNNYYTQDGYSGGSYVNCSDPRAPGVAAVDALVLRTAPATTARRTTIISSTTTICIGTRRAAAPSSSVRHLSLCRRRASRPSPMS